MMPSTARGAFPYPAGTDNWKLLRTQMQALADQAAAVTALYSHANPRPAAGTPGRLHRHPTTGVLSYDTGTAWVDLLTEAAASAAYEPIGKHPKVTTGAGAGVAGIGATATQVCSLAVPDPGYSYKLVINYICLLTVPAAGSTFELRVFRNGAQVRSSRISATAGDNTVTIASNIGNALVGASTVTVQLARFAGVETATTYGDGAFHAVTAITFKEA